MTHWSWAVRIALFAASFPIAMMRLGESSIIRDARISSPTARSRALWARLVNGSSGSWGCKGKTFHKKTGASISCRTDQTTAAVRSATGRPLVGRSYASCQRSACQSPNRFQESERRGGPFQSPAGPAALAHHGCAAGPQIIGAPHQWHASASYFH